MINHHSKRRTKIIATLGPATDAPEDMDRLVEVGVNMVRLNFSHGSHEEHLARIQSVKRAAKKHKRVIGILADLQGPKIRVASFKDKKIELIDGAEFVLDAAHPSDAGTQAVVGIDYKDLPNDVQAGDILLLDDGRLRLEVLTVAGSKIITTVLVGGVLSDHKGINRQGGGLSAKALTEKDKADLAFALKHTVDYVAISFPRNAEDILEAKALIKQQQGRAHVIAKIERVEAVENIEEIIKAADGVMVARGDLGVEIGDEEVPSAQKLIIHRARVLDKPVITATQMMETMIENTVPTRAEVSDVATAVLENTDAVMLSAESAVGKHPWLVVETMSRICIASEKQPQSHTSGHRVECEFHRIDEAIAMAAVYTANHLDVEAIVALTESGATPLWMSRLRTACPIYALSRKSETLGRMTLYRGVYPVKCDITEVTRDDVNKIAVQTLVELGELSLGQKVVLTKGDYMGVGGGSNAMKLLVVGKVL